LRGEGADLDAGDGVNATKLTEFDNTESGFDDAHCDGDVGNDSTPRPNFASSAAAATNCSLQASQRWRAGGQLVACVQEDEPSAKWRKYSAACCGVGSVDGEG
jgi:hypothetical protein